MGVAKLWKGALTVEDAAERIGIEPVTLVGFAALGGIPKGYGPFPSVEASIYVLDPNGSKRTPGF